MNLIRIALLTWLIAVGMLHFSAAAQVSSAAKANAGSQQAIAVKTPQGLEIRLGDTMRESPYMHIYDVNGRMVKVVSLIGFGTDKLYWNYTAYDGSSIKPGMYLVDVRSGKNSEKIKIEVVK